MKGYKLLRQYSDGTWHSVTAINPVQYEVDKPAHPPANGGPLCLFQSIRTAQMFQDSAKDTTIFECDYEPSRSSGAWTQVDGQILKKDMLELPFGTILATEVTVRKQI